MANYRGIVGLVFALLLGAAPVSAAQPEPNWLVKAQLLSARQQDAQALASLWLGLKSNGDSSQQQTATLLAAELCARNGLIEIARSYYLQLLASPLPLASGDRLAIARFFASQGEWPAAENSLESFWQDFPSSLKEEARLLLGLAALAQQQYSIASQRLAFRRPQSAALPYRRYNLAVALNKQGKTYEARKLLQALSRQPAYNREQRLFRDQVRISLAQHYLRHEQGGLATPLLKAIKSDSAYAAEALLLVGWAALTPGTAELSCQTLAASRSCWIEVDQSGHDIQRSPSSISESFAKLRQAQAANTGTQDRLRRALTSWSLALQTQQPAHQQSQPLALLEAKVSLAYGLQTLGKKQAALGHYQQALKALNQAQTPLEPLTQTREWLQRLRRLESSLQTMALPPLLKNKASLAITNAIRYRQAELENKQRQNQQRWQLAIQEYKKQAHLGLASLHQQMSFD